MAVTENGKKYVLGKGRLYFDQFAPGSKLSTGERYLGNSPELSTTQSQDTLDHIDADQGLNVKDESITISNELTGAFALDSIDMQNVALWFGGIVENAVVAAATAIVEPDTMVKLGTWFQLGRSADQPQGTRKVDNVVISTVVPGATPSDPVVVTALTADQVAANFEIDLEGGRVYIEPKAPDIEADTVLRFTYDQEALTSEVVIGRGDEVRGSLRFIANNPKGENKDYYWPYVKITSNGDYALKGDSWQQMSFNFEVLKRDDSTERVYITNRPATA